jgi:hypothetical protein
MTGMRNAQLRPELSARELAVAVTANALPMTTSPRMLRPSLGMNPGIFTLGTFQTRPMTCWAVLVTPSDPYSSPTTPMMSPKRLP